MRTLCLALLLAGCTAGPAPGGAPAASQTLILAAPASLRTEFDAIVAGFHAHHPDQAVTVVTATPLQVVQDNLPVDVVAADTYDAMQPILTRLPLGDRRDFAANPLCLVTRAGANEVKLHTLTVTPWIKKVGIADGRGDATGAATEAALGRLAIRREIADRLVYTPDIPHALDRLAKGELDAAFSRATEVVEWNAKEGNPKLQLADRYGDDSRARLPIGILAGSPRVGAARLLIDEVLHGDGQKLFAQRGLLPPAMPMHP